MCRETRARAARARATAAALRDQAQATIAHCERLLSERDVPIVFEAGVAHYTVIAGDESIEVRVVGEVDVASAESHSSVLRYVDDLLEAHAVPVVVNTEDVTFCASTGLAFLLRLKLLASDANVRFILQHVSEPLQRVLYAAGLDDLASDSNA